MNKIEIWESAILVSDISKNVPVIELRVEFGFIRRTLYKLLGYSYYDKKSHLFYDYFIYDKYPNDFIIFNPKRSWLGDEEEWIDDCLFENDKDNKNEDYNI